MGYYDELVMANFGCQNSLEVDLILLVLVDVIECVYYVLIMNGLFFVYRKFEQDVKGFCVFCVDKGGNVVVE